MRKLAFIIVLAAIAFGCETWTSHESSADYMTAKVVGFDMNCSTCILSFPNDSLKAKSLLGESRNNYYQTVNLDKADFKIGQLLKVKVRKAEEGELRACIAMYPSYGYENIYVETYDFERDFAFNDTIDLGYHDCLYDPGTLTSICLDTVLTDSRCPVDVVCIWAGEATVRFSFTTDDFYAASFDLRIGTKDTLIDGYHFSLIDLLPYPDTRVERKMEDYKARIIIKQD